MGIRRTVRARRISLLPLLAAAALIAGCGSSSGSSSSSASSSTPSTASSASSSTSSSTGTSSSSTSAGASAVAACKRGIQALSQLKPSTREHLEAICEKAASGDVNAKRKAAEEACRELVNASPLPAGAVKERSLAACRHAGETNGAGGK